MVEEYLDKIEENQEVVDFDSLIRKCKGRGLEKPLTREFFHFRNDNQKFRPQCIECIRENDRKKRAKNPEKFKEKNKKSYHKNKKIQESIDHQIIGGDVILNVRYCKECDEYKELETGFSKIPKSKKDIRQYYDKICKECKRPEINKKQKENWAKNSDIYNVKRKAYRAANPEKIKLYKQNYYQKNKEKIKVKSKNYRLNNKEKYNETRRRYNEKNKKSISIKRLYKINEKRNSDIVFRIRMDMSSMIRQYLKRKNINKAGKSITKHLGYTIKELKLHIESQFEPWMTWENRGKYNSKTWDDTDTSTWTWQLDHIKPHSEFKYLSMEDEDFKECWSLENLRPYPSKQNILEGANRTRHKKG